MQHSSAGIVNGFNLSISIVRVVHRISFLLPLLCSSFEVLFSSIWGSSVIEIVYGNCLVTIALCCSSYCIKYRAQKFLKVPHLSVYLILHATAAFKINRRVGVFSSASICGKVLTRIQPKMHGCGCHRSDRRSWHSWSALRARCHKQCFLGGGASATCRVPRTTELPGWYLIPASFQ